MDSAPRSFDSDNLRFHFLLRRAGEITQRWVTALRRPTQRRSSRSSERLPLAPTFPSAAATRVTQDQASTLLGRLLDVIARLPEKECVVDGDRRVTYAELGGSVQAVAAALGDSVSPGARVALLMDNSAEYVAAYYGTWWVGGTAVALNTALKAPDLAQLIRHCGASSLLADPRHPELAELRSLLTPDVGIIELGYGAELPRSRKSREHVSRRPEDLAALMYTSGTTGHPKGVMLSHGNISANVDSICEYLGISESDRALCVLPFFYSYGASVLHTHLLSGATLVLESSFLYPREILRRMVSERVTSFAGVPSTFYLLLRRTNLGAYDLSSLRYVTQAGGRMHPEKIYAFREAVPEADFIVMYGQTEATARLAWVPPSELDRKSGSAGRAVPRVELRVRDETGHDLPPGETGEVCARGDNVMMGYWADPDETGRVLRDGWLRTGDLGTMDADGYLFLQGRSREMIKSGAHRIGPSEIEDVIRAVPGVEDVAVVGTADELLGEVVKACVVTRAGSDHLKQTIQRACRDRLPAFKVPKVVEFRTELPKTSSGKVRRHLL